MKTVLILAAASLSLPAHAFDPGAAVVSRVVSQNNNQIVQQNIPQQSTGVQPAGGGSYPTGGIARPESYALVGGVPYATINGQSMAPNGVATQQGGTPIPGSKGATIDGNQYRQTPGTPMVPLWPGETVIGHHQRVLAAMAVAGQSGDQESMNFLQGARMGVCVTCPYVAPPAPKANPLSSVAGGPAPQVVGPTSLDYDKNSQSRLPAGATRIGNGFSIGNAEPDDVPEWMLKAAQPVPRNSTGSTSMR